MMLKLLSCVLSVTLIFTSVAPSLAQVPARQALRGSVKAVQAPRKISAARSASLPPAATLTPEALLKGARVSLSLPHASLLSGSVPASRQILTQADKAQRSLLLRADFPVLVINQQAAVPDMHQAVQFYREQLKEAPRVFAALPAAGPVAGAQEAKTLAAAVADVAGLGLVGVQATDAPLILQVYEKAVGTAAEPMMTAVCARALLRLKAYGALEEMSAQSALQPELWQSIEQYGQIYGLPVKVAPRTRQTVDVRAFEKEMQPLGPLQVMMIQPQAQATFIYMSMGPRMATQDNALPAQEVAAWPGQPAPAQVQAQRFASQGAPFANQKPVQPVLTAPVPQEVPAALPDPSAPKRFRQVEVVNALGNKVLTWAPVDEVPTTAVPAPAKTLSWLDKARLQWAMRFKPAFQQTWNVATSGYGWAALGMGAAPWTSEVAIAQAGNSIEAVQQIRTAQSTFIAEDFLRGGAGASYRTDAVNPGALFLSRLGQMAAPAAPAKLQVVNSGKVYGSVLPVSPRLVERASNWVRNLGRSSSSGMQAANKQAQSILEKRQPMIAQLRDVVTGAASDEFKKQALVKLYHQGVFFSFLKKQPKAVRNGVTEAADDWERGNALFRLYQAKYLDGVLKAIPSIQAQGSVLAQLQEVIAQEGFADLAKSAYEAEDVLPLQNENFAGAVSGVPEADLKKIGDTVRTEHYATQNASSGVVTAKGVYYANNIPFYYRNSKGELSSEPVGILTQVPATLYGRILSRLHLASQPGLTIPEGFVLALDEQGQWKFFIPKGNLAVVENNPTSKKVLDGINKSGSARVILDTNYSTTDLLAMAHLLEYNPALNLELTLNTPHSLSQFLTGHALFVGNDAGNTLTGPFKTSLKAVEGFANTMTNLVSGVGYLTPIAGGKMMPTMARWGNVKTTKVIYGMAATALAGSLTLLGMNGTVDPATLPLWALAIPTVALVLGASLANSFIPTFLNFYKDPAARTAANLDFSTKKQISRLSLSGIVAGAAALWGLNWTVVVPVGLALLGYSYALFLNTPMYKEEAARLAKEKEANEKEAARWAALTPVQQAAEKKAAEDKKAYQKEVEEQYANEYRDFRNRQAEMQASKSRVKMVYASYAASLMVLGQSANAAFGDIGQGFITLCMAATLGTRLLATQLVKKNIMTDDQLTGLSLPTLALTGLALALLPYSGIAAGVAGLAGILHYMATAVPGQLDAARMQNIVTAEMQQRKQSVLDRDDLTEAEKEVEVAKLTAEEKVWSAQASKDYSLYNARGLWGIGTATAAAFLFADMGPQWTQDMLQWVSNWYDVSSPALSLNRLLFLYSGGVASVLAMKNLDLTADGLRFFGKKTAITTQAIAEQQVTPKTFGINAKNAQIQLGNVTSKTMKELEPMLVEYGISSEQKMTKILQQLQSVHNRLVAISQVLEPQAVRSAFMREANMVKKFAVILGENDLSVMLRREFDALQNGLFTPGTQEVLAQPGYVEEGLYELPAHYQKYEAARMVIAEMDQMAYSLSLNGQSVDYHKFVDYMTRAREDLIQYERANPADAVRVGQLRQKIESLGRWLFMQDKEYNLLAPLPTDSPQIKKGKQALRDMLGAYQD